MLNPNLKSHSYQSKMVYAISKSSYSVTKKTWLLQLQNVEHNFQHNHFSSSLLVQGVLSLANGDCLEGLFSGEWTTGLKVVGTYIKPAVDEPENKERNSLLWVLLCTFLKKQHVSWADVFYTNVMWSTCVVLLVLWSVSCLCVVISVPFLCVRILMCVVFIYCENYCQAGGCFWKQDIQA